MTVRLRNNILLFLICIFLTGTASLAKGQTKQCGPEDYILLLDFYRGTNEWANGITNHITQHLMASKKRFFLKNLFDATTDANKNKANWWKDYFDDLPSGRPRIILLLGDSGWILYRHYVPADWHDIPCVILPARASIVSFENYSHNIEISDNKLVPFTESMKGFKAIGLNHGHYNKQTIDLIKRLQPDVSKIVFISDSRLSSAFVKFGMQKTINLYFKNLKYITLERKNLSTNGLLDSIRKFDKRTGIIFYGWYSSNGTTDNVDYTKKMISIYSKVPIFTLSDYKTLEETSMCGGYYNSADIIGEAVCDVLDKFDKKEYIPWGTIQQIEHPKVYLNYHALLDKGIDPELIPDDAVVLGRPISFYRQHRLSIWLGVIICIILFVLLLKYAWSQRKLRQEKEKEVMHLKRYEVLFNNMPIGYLRYYIYKDLKHPFSFQLVNKNTACAHLLRDKDKKDILPALEQKIFTPDYQLSILDVAIGKPSFYRDIQVEEFKKHYDVYICPSERKLVIDIFVIDKTEQVEVSRKMIEYAGMNRRILEMLPDDIIIFDKDYNIDKLINHSNTETGIFSFNLHSKNVGAEEDFILYKFRKAIDDAFSSEKVVSFEYEIGEGDSKRYFQTRFNKITELLVCCNIHENTEMMKDRQIVVEAKDELEHVNHQLQVVLEAADVLPWTIDLSSNILSVRHNEFSTINILRMIHPDDVHYFQDTIEYLMEDYSHQEFVPHNARFCINGTSYHWYRLRGVVDKRDEKGKPILIIGSAEDIEKQMQIEKNLIESKEKAIESNKLKSTFIANMSHEIRTPLNAIIGFSDLIATKDNLEKEEKELYRKYIDKNKDLLMQLFNDILDSSKIDAGTIEFYYEKEDFSDIIKGIFSSSKVRIEKNDKVEFIIDPMPESCVFCFDAQREAS